MNPTLPFSLKAWTPRKLLNEVKMKKIWDEALESGSPWLIHHYFLASCKQNALFFSHVGSTAVVWWEVTVFGSQSKCISGLTTGYAPSDNGLCKQVSPYITAYLCPPWWRMIAPGHMIRHMSDEARSWDSCPADRIQYIGNLWHKRLTVKQHSGVWWF